jgi:hypothetical protein
VAAIGEYRASDGGSFRIGRTGAGPRDDGRLEFVEEFAQLCILQPLFLLTCPVEVRNIKSAAPKQFEPGLFATRFELRGALRLGTLLTRFASYSLKRSAVSSRNRLSRVSSLSADRENA